MERLVRKHEKGGCVRLDNETWADSRLKRAVGRRVDVKWANYWHTEVHCCWYQDGGQHDFDIKQSTEEHYRLFGGEPEEEG